MYPVIGNDDFTRILTDLQGRILNLERLLGGEGLQAGNSVIATDGSGVATVAFPRPYVVAPIVVAVPSDIVFHLNQLGASATGFSFLAYNSANALLTGTNIRIRWIAFPATS